MAAGVRRLTVETAVMGDRRGPSAHGGPYRTSPLSAGVITQLNDPKEAQRLPFTWANCARAPELATQYGAKLVCPIDSLNGRLRPD